MQTSAEVLKMATSDNAELLTLAAITTQPITRLGEKMSSKVVRMASQRSPPAIVSV
jgi:hypothetical protein